MAATLRDTLLAPEVQPQVVADCEALVNGEVATMSGVSGTGPRRCSRSPTSAAGTRAGR